MTCVSAGIGKNAHAFVFSKLAYCNGVFKGLSKKKKHVFTHLEQTPR